MAPAQSTEDLSIQALLSAVESAIRTTAPDQWLALLSLNANRDAAGEFFAAAVPPGVTHAVIRERDRVPLGGALPGDGFQLIVDAFLEAGPRGRIDTWRLDIRKPHDSSEPQPWRVLAYERLSTVEGLHRLALHPLQQFAVKDLLLRAVDLELRLPTGDVFIAETADGVTGMVLLGEGLMTFAPEPVEERGQLRLYAGTDALETPFSAAFVRLHPFDYEQQVKPQLAASVALDPRALRRAQTLFDEEVGKSFSLDLRDLSRDTWSLLPQPGDFVAEVRTRRFNTLTYARALGQPEDVTLFHRVRQRNISSYASAMKLSSRGRFFNEDDLVEYDVVNYLLDATFSPEREWLDGRALVKIRIKVYALAALTLRLADDFNVSSITSDRLGRLMFLRVRNQNDVVINLPSAVPRDFEMTLDIAYSGPIRTQPIEQESIDFGQLGRPQRSDDLPYVPPEPNWLFSNRSHWYPQNQVSDYATATVRFNVPADHTVIASGVEAVESPVVTAVTPTGSPARHTFVYEAAQPVRYIGAVISKFTRVDRAAIALDVKGPRTTITLSVDANRRQLERGRDLVPTAAEIIQLYTSLLGEAPYSALTVAMIEHDRPGGHSPAFFAVLNNPLPITPWAPRHDPAAFNSFPEFYIAHEIAHQWWGQAVGWKNYHEQWLSEGLAQYFSALYAKERRGEAVFKDMLRHFRRWAMDQSDQGAIYLGYRLGHIKGDSRVFRAIVYNKGASVVHMLRRWLGDEHFFAGLRRYYDDNKFKKAGSEDLQRAMEAVSGQSLDRFFERWVYGSGTPRIRYVTTTEGQQAVIRFEQVGDIYDLPVTVSLVYADRTVEHVVAVTDSVVEQSFPITAGLRSIEVNADAAALAHFERK